LTYGRIPRPDGVERSMQVQRRRLAWVWTTRRALFRFVTVPAGLSLRLRKNAFPVEPLA
jgi:hypothetical protein